MNQGLNSTPQAVRLLIIEDSRADAELIVACLKQHGFMVQYDYVSTPDEFQRHLGHPYDAILCDHDLHSWLGLEALSMLRQAGKIEPFLVVTGAIGEEAAVEYIKQGAADYLLKNRLDRLPMALERALQDRRKMEENIRLQKEILCAKQEWELTFDAVPDAILLLDQNGTIRRANRSATTLLGLKFAGLVGERHSEVFHPTEKRPPNCPFCALQETGHSQRCDVRLPALNKIYDVVAAPMRGSSGSLIGGTVVMRDVSERVRFDEQLRQAQKMEAVGILAGGVAHDFNNLLNVISGNAEILRGQTPAGAQPRPLDEITQAASRAARLTSQLLAFSRKQVLQPKVIDLNAVVSDYEKMLSRLIGEDIKLRTNLQTGMGSVRADQDQIGQVLMNLVTNARDAMPQGGMITIETAEVKLTPADREKYPYIRPGSYVCLSVMDTGHGMSPEEQDRVFEPFFTTKAKGHGTGLGLAVAYGVVKQSGGYIWCTSEPGKGTRFDAYLPRLDEVPKPTKDAGEGRKEDLGGTETVLVLEDEDALLHVMSEFLARSGYSVLGSNHPRQAIEIAKQHTESIPLAILDTILPEMNGPAVAEELKKIHPEMTFLFISGYADRPVLDHVLGKQWPFLQKPISKITLLREVHRLLHPTEVRSAARSA